MKSGSFWKTNHEGEQFGAAVKFFQTVTTQSLSALGGLVLAGIVARIGGPEELGKFTVLLSMAGVLGMISQRGQGSLLTRAVAWTIHEKGVCASVSLLLVAICRTLLFSIVLGLIGSALLLSEILGSPFWGAVPYFPLILLIVTSLALFAAYARGSSRPWLAPLFELGGISFLTALLLMPWLVLGRDVTSAGIMSCFLLSMLILVLVAGVIAWADHPLKPEMLSLSDNLRKELIRGQVPFMLIAMASFLIQSGSFLLAAPFLSEADIGFLRAAERLALLVSFPILAINPVIVPRIVRLSRGAEGAGLRQLMTRAMMMSGGIAAPVLLVLLVWPDRALTVIGAEFGAATGYLRIMALAQFATALLGPLAMLLNMSGRERASMWINVGTLALTLGLIPLACEVFGALGFALTYSAAILLRLGLIGMIVVIGRKPVSSRDSVNP